MPKETTQQKQRSKTDIALEQASEAEPVSAVAVRMAIARRLSKIGANKRETEFLLSCELPDIDDWCATNLDDLRRSQ